MRDSWIDKAEFEELVGSFSTPKKGLRRSSRQLLRKERPASESGKGGSQPCIPGASPEMPGDIVADAGLPVVTDVDNAIDPCLTGLGRIFELDEEEEDKSLESLDPACSEFLMSSVPEPEVQSPPVGDDSGERLDFHVNLPFFEPSEFEGPAIGLDTNPETSEVIEIFENVVIEEAPDSQLSARSVPVLFGDDDGPPEIRLQSLSERDADRAMLALAGARAKVDQCQLIRIHPLDFQPRNETSMGGDLIAINDKGGDPPEFSMKAEDEIVFECRGDLHERIVHFGNRVQRELKASEVAVCDKDGLLLYSSSGSGDRREAEAARFVEFSGRVTRMLGLKQATATQIADGSGAWRCLISGAGSAGDVFAGFSLQQPLDQSEIDTWTKALAEALNPSHRCI